MTTTIILTVSRDDFLPEVISALELIDCDASYTNILCIVDGDAKLFTKVRNLIQNTKFNERLTVKFPDPKPVKKFDVVFRRKRIASIHRFAKDLVSELSQFVFLVEDDTIVPRNALNRLTTVVNNIPGCVMAEGVEVGRWGTPYIGAWQFDDIYEPTSVTSLAYKTTGVEMIDAGGFYCSVFETKVYKEHNFELFESLGPDISMGLELRRQGFTNAIDWSVPCRHLNRKRKGEREILIPSEDTEQTTLQRKSDKTWVQIY